MSYILKLAGWYPSKLDMYNGDFVQRHAKSIALYSDIVVIYIVKDECAENICIEEKTEGRLTEIIAYYPKRKLFDKFLSHYFYFKIFKKIITNLFNKKGLPKLVHVNIVWKAGLLAMHLKKKFKLPYIITENWTGYYPEDPNFISNNKVRSSLFKKVYQNASYLLPVTEDLAERCNKLFGTKLLYTVIENAVDTSLFYPAKDKKKTIVHISTMGYQKNTVKILDVVPQILLKYPEYNFQLIGPSNEEVERKIDTFPNHIKSKISSTGNIPYANVAQYLREASFLVLFSRYENLPCVILESLCCGVPVISTNVGGIREVISIENGLLVQSENTESLHNGLCSAIENSTNFFTNTIAANAKKEYSYESIGKKYTEAYEYVLK